MKKKALMALITMLVVTSMSVAGNGSDKKDKRVVPPSPRGQLYKGLDLSEEQMTQMQKINRDFATERRQSFTKEKKEKMARKQEHVKKLRKESKKMHETRIKMQRDYLSSVRKVMNEKQYIAFLENYWVKGHAVPKADKITQGKPYQYRNMAYRSRTGSKVKVEKGYRGRNVRTIHSVDSIR